MATFTVNTTPEQDAAIAELLALRARQMLPVDRAAIDRGDEQAETAGDLIQAWAVHPINARLEDARRRAAREEAVSTRVAVLTSDDPDIRAEAEALDAQFAALAARARGGQAPRS